MVANETMNAHVSAHNPLRQIPKPILADSMALFDSTVICSVRPSDSWNWV